MRTAILLALCSAAVVAAQNHGLPVRGDLASYPAHSEAQGITIAAEIMDPDQIQGSFATDLSNYVVVEVAVYPKKDGTPLELWNLDFALRADGRMVRPAEPWSIAGINQKKANARRNDIVLYPSVGVTTGTWGTGTMIGVGVGTGGNAPGPASSDRDREVMETELRDKALPEATIIKPVAGYLYFPAGKKRSEKYILDYNVKGVEVKLDLEHPKTR